VALKGFYPDMLSSESVDIEQLLDLPRTNANLIGTALVAQHGTAYTAIGMHTFSKERVTMREFILRALVFAAPIRALAASISPPGRYYCVHYRLEVDVVVYYRKRAQYAALIEHTRNNLPEALRIARETIDQNREWIIDQVHHYAHVVQMLCRESTLPVFVLTAVGKPLFGGLNDTMEWAYTEFASLVHPKTLVRNNSFPSIGREHAAAVELNVACNENCAGFIATDGSTFSRTIMTRIDPSKSLYTVYFSDTDMPVFV
jgi:hypothetical protein